MRVLSPHQVQFSRAWAMPSGETFSIKPVAAFLERWTSEAGVIVDPFARNSKIGTHTNDLDLGTTANRHMDAEDYCRELTESGTVADVVIFDPPYSPRQISECYRKVGREVGRAGTQSAALYKRARAALAVVLKTGGVALSFGWNSCGFGKDWETLEILLVAHGGAHNDTICLAQRKPAPAKESR